MLFVCILYFVVVVDFVDIVTVTATALHVYTTTLVTNTYEYNFSCQQAVPSLLDIHI